MKHFVSFLIVAWLLTSLRIQPIMASDDFYANSIYGVTNQILDQSRILGSPDQSYATFISKDATVTLDMGSGEEGTGDLTLYFELLNYGAQFQVEFMNAEFNILQTYGNIFALSTTSVTVNYTKSVAYRYVRITSISSQMWKLDAIKAASVVASSATQTTPTTPSTADANPRPAAGLLVKLKPESGIPADVSSTVYVIGNDGKRHAFPNDTVFHSWFRDFSTVTEIDTALMASYSLGKNITIRPGTYLVKITTDPKVYAVETGGILRWIPNEGTAAAVFGSKWKERVVDVSDVFFGNYKTGTDLQVAHPNGSVIVLPAGEVVYLNNSFTYSIPGDVLTYMRFTSAFYAPASSTLAALYKSGGTLTKDPVVAFPY